ncbi:HAMP domain-containing sensor histidine kinase [Leifsonia sp. fls2-241-R2A-40a]|uniref:sensor histidine kinase n=1 Tax=Leifsonia sp. fls2-241-R2A-40a TaxID=3040290 RepID=UPI00254BE24A|nr:HAMP domain-containing sensor histidine kinase [Leifsonia sp. fls2-241-R2A-40a]
MLSFADLQLIALTTVCCTVAANLVAILVLRRWRGASIASRFAVVVGAAVAAIAGSTIAIAAEMYFSHHDLTVLLWVVSVSSLLSLLGAWIVARQLRRSARLLRDSARRVGAGEVIEAGAHAGRELTEISERLAEASERLALARAELEQLDASRRTFFAWISHDLRTPLTGVQALAEALDDGLAADPADYVRRIRQQANSMSRLVNDLFELSSLQSGGMRPRREPVALMDLVSDAASELRQAALSRGVTVVHGEVADGEAWVDPHLLSRMVVNLLANAVRHAPQGTTVMVSAQRSGRMLRLSVCDQGDGVPPADLERMFEVGWRGDVARTPRLEAAMGTGAGLGLAIVRAIAEAHAGEVRAEHSAGGFSVSVTLPLDAPPEPALLA